MKQRYLVCLLITSLTAFASGCAAIVTPTPARFALTPPYLTPIAATATIFQSPAATPSANSPSARTPQVFTDEQFGYEITIPNDWQVTPLKGTSQGASELPHWSALISNVQVESMQSRSPDAAFIISIHRQPFAAEEEVMVYIARQVAAQPGDILRQEQGKIIEYYTANMLADRFNRPTAARWFWDGKQLLSVSVIIFDRDSVEPERIMLVLDSVRLLNP